MFNIKICGITNAADARAAEEAGADAIGLNFYSRSLRHVTHREALAILESVSSNVTKVGVFVDQTPQQVNDICSECGLDAIQLHGEQDEDFIAELECDQVIRALRWTDAPTFQQQQMTTLFTKARTVLLDAHQGKQFGGTGTTIAWDETIDVEFVLPLVLAGGLSEENVAEAITTVRPNGVDVAGGVENLPGQKDHQKIARFVEQAQSAMAITSPKNTSLG